jgi:hypothetical protein
MSQTIYTINKGINKAIEFKGVKAQYIWHLAGTVVGALIGFGILHAIGLNSYVCVVVTLGGGGLLVSRVFRMSKKYGQYGLMKRSARRSVPSALITRSRQSFTQLYSSYASTTR